MVSGGETRHRSWNLRRWKHRPVTRGVWLAVTGKQTRLQMGLLDFWIAVVRMAACLLGWRAQRPAQGCAEIACRYAPPAARIDELGAELVLLPDVWRIRCDGHL